MQNSEHILFQRNWHLEEETIFMLGQSESIVQAISSAPIKPEYRKQLLSVSLRKGARATTAIEGNTLSEEEVSRIDEGENLPPSKEYLQIEVKNIIDALNQIRTEVISEEKAFILSPKLIERFNYFVGKNLGDQFHGMPGKFRASGHNVVVGTYRPPQGEQVTSLMTRFCEWMRDLFRYEEGKQSFSDQVLQAIVAHIYIAMIHPFGDGNGRTARLIEFYILLRAGLPDMASHILSNHYNDTRQEYYRQLDLCVRTRDLSGFIKYAVLGFRDGLKGVLDIVQMNLLEMSWHKFIYDVLDSKKATGKTRAIVKRRRTLALHFPSDKWNTPDDLVVSSGILAKEYARLSPTTIMRDFAELEKLGLIVKEKNKFKGNIEIMRGYMPMRKTKMKI
ncbi:MAG: Fic family protein [Proteobacteria bacterium]|nr:Fic family protein [Pseudomonadota bacterium]MBU1713582.1 Fic family protein [Pseudomonadota bacterium]